MKGKVKVNTPILIHNTEHRNFVETDKVVPEGTILEGERINIIGKRKGKEFVYRLFKDKDGILIYEKYIEPMEINLNANGEADTRVVTLPSVKNDTRTHAIISVVAGVLAYGVAKKMGRTGQQSLIIGGVSALLGYGIATYITKNQKITISNK
jgi:hypothetical protein